MIQLSDRSPIVDQNGRPSRVLIRWAQELFNGLHPRTTYTAADLANMAPEKVSTAICSDLDMTGLSFGDVIVGGGSDVRPVFYDGAVWRVG